MQAVVKIGVATRIFAASALSPDEQDCFLDPAKRLCVASRCLFVDNQQKNSLSHG